MSCEESKAEILKTQFMNKLENCIWYDGAGVMGFFQETDAAPISHTRFVTLFFNGIDNEDEQILENFSNQLISEGTRCRT